MNKLRPGINLQTKNCQKSNNFWQSGDLHYIGRSMTLRPHLTMGLPFRVALGLFRYTLSYPMIKMQVGIFRRVRQWSLSSFRSPQVEDR